MKIIKQRSKPQQIPKLTDSPVLDAIYASRGIESKEQLDYKLSNLISFKLLKGIEQAVNLLAQTIEAQQKILIVGDFDCDGATSSVLCKLVLEKFGVQNVDYLVPNRFEYGYGLSPELVEVAKLSNPDLIITVDNGISSIEGVKLAQSYGIKVLVTDHHLAGEQLPSADAIINPNQPGCKFPSKNLAGVGVVFYLLLALRAYLRDSGWFESQNIAEPNLAHYLDIVALGTVADVVSLDQNNRLLVHHGLKLIKAQKCRPGILQLLQLAKRKPHKISASDLGFAVGPRLNAAGRLDDMGLGIECLLTEDKAKAQELAQILNSLNTDRRQVEQDMQDEALEKLEIDKLATGSLADDFENSLCLYEAHWHQGVVGLLASRIKDKVAKPCVVFANENDDNIKGSARSVKEVHIRDALALVDAREPKLISKFGGHAMAAGLSMPRNNFEAFQKAFEQAVTDLLAGNTIEDLIETDGELHSEQINLETAQLLAQAGPFGQSFPEPLFEGVFKVLNKRIVGENHLKLTLTTENNNQKIQAIAFRIEPSEWLEPVDSIKAVYKLDINDYYNLAEAQLIIQHLEKV